MINVLSSKLKDGCFNKLEYDALAQRRLDPAISNSGKESDANNQIIMFIARTHVP